MTRRPIAAVLAAVSIGGVAGCHTTPLESAAVSVESICKIERAPRRLLEEVTLYGQPDGRYPLKSFKTGDWLYHIPSAEQFWKAMAVRKEERINCCGRSSEQEQCATGWINRSVNAEEPLG